MCGPVPLLLTGHKGAALGSMVAGLPGALIGNAMDKKRKDKPTQHYGDGTVVDGAMS